MLRRASPDQGLLGPPSDRLNSDRWILRSNVLGQWSPMGRSQRRNDNAVYSRASKSRYILDLFETGQSRGQQEYQGRAEPYTFKEMRCQRLGMIRSQTEIVFHRETYNLKRD